MDNTGGNWMGFYQSGMGKMKVLPIYIWQEASDTSMVSLCILILYLMLVQCMPKHCVLFPSSLICFTGLDPNFCFENTNDINAAGDSVTQRRSRDYPVAGVESKHNLCIYEHGRLYHGHIN